MSYTTKFTETISGSVSGSFSYPASQNGGSHSVTLHWSEPVNVVVRVEDDPFKSSVNSCRSQVDLMTASVAATEAAQIASKMESSRQVGVAITDGFNGLIQSEISQQMIEIEAMMPPKMQELRALSDRCVGLRQQMERDFARIGERYGRLFSDLDSELKRRILALDQKTFTLCQEVGIGSSNEALAAPVVGTVLSAGEQSGVANSLQSHRIRQRASGMVESARRHLVASRSLVRGMRRIQDNEPAEKPIPMLMPIAVIDAEVVSGKRQLEMMASPQSRLNEEIQKRCGDIAKILPQAGQWEPMDEMSRRRLNERLDAKIIALVNSQGGSVSLRKTEMMQKLWGHMRPNAPKGGTR